MRTIPSAWRIDRHGSPPDRPRVILSSSRSKARAPLALPLSATFALGPATASPSSHGDSVLGHGYAHAVSGSWQPILRCVCRVQLWAIGSLRSELETASTAATAGRGERTTLFRLDVVSLANTGRTWI